MAKQLNVNLSFTADTSQAAAQVQNLQRQLTQLANQPVPIGAEWTPKIREAASAAAELKIHLQNATNVNTGVLDFSKLNQSLKQSGVSLTEYAAKIKEIGPQGQQAFMQLARSVANAEVPLKRANTMLQQFGTTLINTARWQLSSSMLHGFMGAVSSAWNYSQNLNESLNNIRIVTGKNIEEMSRFADQANRAAKALSTTTTEYTNASLIYYQQGLSDSEVMGRAETTIKLANVSRQSAEIVSDQMTAIWNNFYDGSKSLEYYADVVTALGAATASSSEEISQGLEKFAAVAETVGLSYEYATAALATVTATTRQSADVVGTAFKTLFARIQDLDLGKTLEDGTTLGSYSEALMKVGINIKDSNGELKKMDDILNEMGTKWQQIDKDQQVALAKSVAGVRQYTQLIALMDNWDFMKENLSTAAGASGSLEKQAKIYAESWEAASNRVKASLEAIYSSVMDDKFFIKLTNNFASLIDGVGRFVKSIGGLQGLISGIGLIATKVFSVQLSKGFENLVYNIQMSTAAGQKYIQTQKQMQMEELSSLMSNKMTGSDSDIQASKVYQQELQLQSELAEKSSDMTAEEQKRYQVLLDQHNALGQQSIELAKQVELLKEKSTDISLEVIGEGMNNTQKTFKEMSSTMDELAKKANGLGDIKMQFESIKDKTSMSKEEIDQLKASLRQVGMQDTEIKELSHCFDELELNGGQATGAINEIKVAINSIQGENIKKVLKEAGIEEGTAKYKQLTSSLKEYINVQSDTHVNTEKLKNVNKTLGTSFEDLKARIKASGAEVQGWSSNLTGVFSGVMSLGMLISSLNGLADTLKDPDVSGWEKFGAILTSISMVGMSVMGVLSGITAASKLFTETLNKENLAKLANAIASHIQAEASKKVAQQQDKEEKETEETTDKINEQTAAKVANKVVDEVEFKGKDGKTRKFAGDIDNKGRYKDTNGQIISKKYVSKNGLDKVTFGSNTAGTGTAAAGTGTAAASLSSSLGTIASAAAPFLVLAAAIAAVAVVVWQVSEAYNKEAKEAAQAAESAKMLNQIHEETKQKYDELKTSISDYNSALEGIEKLTEGTIEFEDAITDANEKAMKLINTYSDLQGKYSIDNKGLIHIDEQALEDVQRKESERLRKVSSASQFMQRRAEEKQREADELDFKRKKLRTNEDSKGVINGIIGGALGGAAIGAAGGAAFAGIGAIPGLIAGAITGAIAGGVGVGVAGTSTKEEDEAMDKIYDLYKEQGNAIFAKDTFEKLLKEQGIESDLIEDLVKNTDEIKKYVSEKKGGEDAERAQFISEYLRANPDVAQHKNAEAIAAMAWEENQKNKNNNEDYGVNNLDNAELMKAYMEEVLGETVTKQGSGVGSAWVGENYKIADTGGQGYSLYAKNAEGEWVLQGDKNAQSLANAREALKDSRGKEESYDKSKEQIAETEKLVAQYKAAGIKNNDLINKLIDAKTKGENASLTLEEYLDLQKKDLSDLDKESQEFIEKNMEAYEKNKPDFFKNEEFKKWYEGLSESEKQIYETEVAVNINEDMTMESVQASVQNAQAWLDQNGLKTAITVRDELETFLQGNERYNLTEDENGKTGEDKFFDLLLNSGIVDSKYLNKDGTLSESGKNYYRGLSTPEIEAMLRNLQASTSEDWIESTRVGVASGKAAVKKERGNIKNYNETISENKEDIEKLEKDSHNKLYNAGKRTDAKHDGTAGQVRLADARDIINHYNSNQSLDNLLNNVVYSNEDAYGKDNITAWQVLSKFSSFNADDPTTRTNTINEYTADYINQNSIHEDQDLLGLRSLLLTYLESQHGDYSQEQLIQLLNNSMADQESRTALIENALDFSKSMTTDQQKDLMAYFEGGSLAQWQKDQNDEKIAEHTENVNEAQGNLDTSKANIKETQEKIKAEEARLKAQTLDQMRTIENPIYGIDSEQFDEYVLSLKEAAKAGEGFLGNLKDNEVQLTKIAQANARLEQGTKDLTSNWETWSAALKSGGLESASAMNDLKMSIANILNVKPEEVSNDFIEEHYDLIERAAKGSVEAINELKTEAAEDILVKANFDYSKVEGGQEALSLLMDQVASEELKIGATLDDSEFASSLYNMLLTAGTSVEDMQKIFDSLGWTPEIDYLVADADTEADASGYVDINGVKTYVGVGQKFKAGTKIPYIKTDGKGTPTFNFRGPTNLMAAKPKGGGGGGSKKPAEQKKKSDVVDRYKEITDMIDDNTDAMEAATRAADRMYGKDRIEKMEQANKLLAKEVDLLKEKRKQAEAYLKEDGDALVSSALDAGITFTFDEAGNITNYTEEMTKLYDEIHSVIEQANKDGNADESETEEINKLQEKIDKVKEAISTYEDTINTIEDLDTEIEEKMNEWQDANYEILNLELELKIELNQDDMSYIDYWLNKIADDFYSMSEVITLMGNNQLDLHLNNLENQKKYIDDLNTAFADGEISEASYIEGLRSANDAIYEELQNIQELDKKMVEYYGETLQMAQEELAKYTDQIEHCATALEHYVSIAELVGKTTNYELIGKIYAAQTNIAKNTYEVSQANYIMLKKQLEERQKAYSEALTKGASEDELKILKKQLEDIQAAANEAQDKMMSDAEAWAEALRKELDNELSKLGQKLENELAGGFGSFDAMNTAFERRNSLQEEYLTTTNKIYETNKLMRTAQQEIDKITNQTAKAKLKQFINETSALQKQSRLSQYELDIQQAKYNLLLAEIALREAQNAKSTVRLQRDSEGNFGYVYTADQGAIAEAQQKFEDAENALYNKALEGANNYVQKYQETMSEMYDTLSEINQNYLDGMYESEEEYHQALENAKLHYYEKLTQYSDLYQVAVGTDARAATEAWTSEFANITQNTQKQMDTVSGYISNVKGAFDTWKEAIKPLNDEYLADIDTTLGNITAAASELARQAEEDVIPKIDEELNKILETTTAYGGLKDSVALTIEKFEGLVGESIEVIKKLAEMETQAKNTATAINTAYTATPSNKNVGSTGGNGTENNNSFGGGSSRRTEIIKAAQYYVGLRGSDIDGAWGPKSQKAAKEFANFLDLRSVVMQIQNIARLYGDQTYGGITIKSTDISDPDYGYKTFDTGGYTGEWGPYGKMAMLHEKELVLNKHDTENFLSSMEVLHRILEIIDLQSMSSQIGGILSSPVFNGMNSSTIEQNVHIEASFPNATNHSEIEEAFNNLINMSSQYANRK